jgi:hypothetical protein
VNARRRLFTFVSAAAIPATIFACGSDGKKKVDSGIQLIDGSGGGGGCTAAASYSGIGSGQSAENFPAGSNSGHTILYGALLNADTTPDAVQLELYQGFGAFGSGDIKNGTYQITGEETNYATCGVCVRIFTDIVSDGSGGASSTDDYFATGGTVTLTSVSGNTFSGTLSNVAMTHVTIDPQTFNSTPVGDCNSNIANATMNTPLTLGSATFQVTGTIHSAKRLGHRHL